MFCPKLMLSSCCSSISVIACDKANSPWFAWNQRRTRKKYDSCVLCCQSFQMRMYLLRFTPAPAKDFKKTWLCSRSCSCRCGMFLGVISETLTQPSYSVNAFLSSDHSNLPIAHSFFLLENLVDPPCSYVRMTYNDLQLSSRPSASFQARSSCVSWFLIVI